MLDTRILSLSLSPIGPVASKRTVKLLLLLLSFTHKHTTHPLVLLSLLLGTHTLHLSLVVSLPSDPENKESKSLVLTEGSVLGGGAFSRVSIVTEDSTGRTYALKRMRKSAVVQCPEHVFCEQAITKNVAHPFCIRQYASFQVGGCVGVGVGVLWMAL